MTRISRTNTLPYAEIPRKDVTSYKQHIDTSIHDNWSGGIAHRDFALMPAFIARANEKDKNLHAFFLPNGIKELTEKIDDLTRHGVTAARFVVNVGERAPGRMRYHFAAFDYKATPGERASLIGVDPAIGIDPALDLPPALRARFGTAIMLDELETTFRTRFPGTAVIFMETSIQKSEEDCGMFSLAFVKKMSQEKSAFDKIHKKNIAGQLGEHTRIDPLGAYKLLPPSFLKHGHSRSTLASFRAMQRESRDESSRNTCSKIFSPLHRDPLKQTVSKKRDTAGKKYTLESWQHDRLVTRMVAHEEKYEEKKISRSIELKRQGEIDKLLVPK